jgi:SAM-dependent methyltransferase
VASIQFLTSVPISRHEGGFHSDLASARYRVITPALQLARRGHKVDLAQIQLDANGVIDPTRISAEVVVISKSLNPPLGQRLAQDLKAAGKTVVVDQCDNYFDHAVRRDRFRTNNIAMCDLADVVIASTPTLAEAIRHHTGRQAVVISDPVEGPRGEPRLEPRFPRVRLLWFGHPSNWPTIEAIIPRLRELAVRTPLELTVVTTPIRQITAFLGSMEGLESSRFQLRVKPWSVAMVWESLAQSDIVLIPSGESDFHAAKSPNRLAEALWAGRHVVAHPVPSYEAFREYVWLGEDLVAGIEAAVESASEIPARLQIGQTYVARHHSPHVIGMEWERALGVEGVSQGLRLNLGCGDKILPGYVNVDVVESRRGHRPDVLCDLHHLTPFSDNSADEIIAIHVVEHFWRWEIRDVLKEWVRVLRPGGRMVLECPNLQSACQHLLEDPASRVQDDLRGQRSMWVFYGDPAWKDPYMIHRWGYTPYSLAELMREVGLVEVRQEPAQYKLREPRDMRVVGIKREG